MILPRTVRVALAGLVLLGCSRPPAPRLTPPPPPAAPVAAAAPAADPAADPLNLSFERATDGRPDGWTVVGEEYTIAAEPVAAHAGQRGLRLAAAHAERFGAATATLDPADARGQRVHLSGWIHTSHLSGWASLVLRADGQKAGEVLGFDNMPATRPTGSTAWKRYEVTVDVPESTRRLLVGAMIYGTGEAWVDDLELRHEPIPAPVPVALAGLVRAPDGSPAAGAVVAAVPEGAERPAEVAHAGDDGRFGFHLPPGSYAFTATGAAGAAAYLPPRGIAADAPVELTLARGGFTLTGTLRGAGTLQRGSASVQLSRTSDDDGDIFVVDVDAQGGFVARLPAARGYRGQVVSERVLAEPFTVDSSHAHALVIAVDPIAPPPDQVVEWVRHAALPLTSVESGHGFDDLRPLARVVGSARIVGLGEATHGTREFFQLKHRLLEYLVEEQGFRLFAMEAPVTETRRLNDYVLHGTGTAREALFGLHFGVWNTEEVLALIEWMRTYDADPAHVTKVQIVGIDMQMTSASWPGALAYLEQVDPTYARTLPDGLGAFAHEMSPEAWKALPAAERKTLLGALDALVVRLDSHRGVYVKSAGQSAWRYGREDTRAVAQAAHMRDGEDPLDVNVRDAAMAENLTWLLAQEGPGARVVLWAHNLHVARAPYQAGIVDLGEHLAQTFGARYLSLGFVLGDGSFHAIDRTRGAGASGEVTLETAPETDVSQAFRRAGCSLCIVDLRRATGPVAAWFRALHPQRVAGAVYTGEADLRFPGRLSRLYDAVIYVDRTTSAHPLAAPAQN